MVTATATATEERQRNGGNRALVICREYVMPSSTTTIVCAYNVRPPRTSTNTRSTLTTARNIRRRAVGVVPRLYRRYTTHITSNSVTLLAGMQICCVRRRPGLLDHIRWVGTSSHSGTTAVQSEDDQRLRWYDVGAAMTRSERRRKILHAGTERRQVADDVGRLQVQTAVARVRRPSRRLQDRIHARRQDGRHDTLVAEAGHGTAWTAAAARQTGWLRQSLGGSQRSQAEPVVNGGCRLSRWRIAACTNSTIGSTVPLQYWRPVRIQSTSVARIDRIMRRG